MHLIKNAVDHGIKPPEEKGKTGENPEGILGLKAYQEANDMVVKVGDDG